MQQGESQTSFEQWAVAVLADTLHQLEQVVPAPAEIPLGTSFVFRYREKTIEQAIVLKLARVVSGLEASTVLLNRRLYQEQGVILRVLDEVTEDTLFLSLGCAKGSLEPSHRKYLAAFWDDAALEAVVKGERPTKPNLVPRSKIHAYVARMLAESPGIPFSTDASATLSTIFSNYVHASSLTIMDMYGGNPPRFHPLGDGDALRFRAHRLQAANHHYRGLIAGWASAAALKQYGVADELRGKIALAEQRLSFK